MHRRAVSLLLILIGCDGDRSNDVCDLRDPLSNVQQSFQYRCSQLNPDVETDLDSPDFGLATCSVIEGQYADEHPEFCACDIEGYRPIAPDDAQAAADRARQEGFVADQCDTHLCFCERQQLTGDDLDTCQQEGVRAGRNGWCYVAPELGIGTVQALKPRHSYEVAYCDNPQAILYTGDYLDGIRFTSCWR